VQDARDDELLIRAELTENPRGLCRVAIVRTGRADVSHVCCTRCRTLEVRPDEESREKERRLKHDGAQDARAEEEEARRRIGPYCWNVRQVYFCCGGSSPYTTFEPSRAGSESG